MSRHQVHLRVRYAETDQMGVVYHANYLIWMEIGRVELVRSRGFNYKDLEHTEGICFPSSKHSAAFCTLPVTMTKSWSKPK